MAQLIVDGKGTVEEVKEGTAFPDKKRRGLDFERVTNYLEEGRAITQEFEIGQREATWKPRPEYPDLPIVLLLASDIHYGSVGVNYKQLREHLDMVEFTPNFYIASNGDDVDAFNAMQYQTDYKNVLIPVYNDFITLLNSSGISKIAGSTIDKELKPNYSVNDNGKGLITIWNALVLDIEVELTSGCIKENIKF